MASTNGVTIRKGRIQPPPDYHLDVAHTALLEQHQHIDVLTGTKERDGFVRCPAGGQRVVNSVIPIV